MKERLGGGNIVLIENSSPTLVGQRVMLRRFESTDVMDFYNLYSNQTVNKYLPLLPISNIEEAETLLKSMYLDKYDAENTYHYAIYLRNAEKVIGALNISDDDSHDLGYLLLDEYWNKGFITEACTLLIDHLKDIGYPYITATHDVNNIASGKVMKKLGMKYRYSYRELWQPKNFEVTFRMYQLNINMDLDYVYMKYWKMYEHSIESAAFKI